MGRPKTERMVAISVVLPKTMYVTLKQDADKQQVVVAELVRSMIDKYLGMGDEEKIDQAYALDLLRTALSKKDVLAEAIQKAVTAYIDSRATAIS